MGPDFFSWLKKQEDSAKHVSKVLHSRAIFPSRCSCTSQSNIVDRLSLHISPFLIGALLCSFSFRLTHTSLLFSLSIDLLAPLGLLAGVFCIGYCVVEPPRPGKLDMQKARGLGVPAGPLLGALKAGQSVTLPGGREVHPADTIGPEQSGRCVLLHV